ASISDHDSHPELESFHLGRRGELPAPAPGGLALLSGIYDLSATDGGLDVCSGVFTVDLDSLALSDPSVALYALQGGTWVPLGGTADFSAMTLAAAFTASGMGNDWESPGFVVAAFGVPSPSGL